MMANKPGKGPGTYEAFLSAKSSAEALVRAKEWSKARQEEADLVAAIKLKEKPESEWSKEEQRRVLDAILDAIRRDAVREAVVTIKLEAMPAAEAELRRILLERVRPKPSQAPGPSNAPQPSKAAKNFDVLVEVVEQVCKSKQIVPHATTPCANRIKKAVDAILRAKRMEPAGIGRLKRALGDVRASGQKEMWFGFFRL